MVLILFSFVFAFCICGLIIRYRNLHERFSGDHDFTGPQKFHEAVTPRIGGVAIILSLIITTTYKCYINAELGRAITMVLLSTAVLFCAGLSEDITKDVKIKTRLSAGFISGLIFLFIFDITSIRLDINFLNYLLNIPWFVIIFLAFAITGLSNAYNIIDGFNGLASMVAMISVASISYLAFKVGDPLVLNLGLIIFGSIFGFFLWNYPRGLIFLGDGGAYLIGFLISALSILLISRNQQVSPWFAIMVNAYPIFETLFTIWRRIIYQRKNPGAPDGAHFHSLIYRRIMRRVHRDKHTYVGNAHTSPYLWLISSLGVIPALLWWDSTNNLIICSILFMLIYSYCYRKLLTFSTSNFSIFSYLKK